MGRIKEWEELTICDNFLFQKVMQNQRLCKRLIEKLLHIRIKSISYPAADSNYDLTRICDPLKGKKRPVFATSSVLTTDFSFYEDL